jgi:phenylacetate-CoA ligase
VRDVRRLPSAPSAERRAGIEPSGSCGRTFSRFVVPGRLDDRFTVSGVNVFPCDIEFIVRNVDGLSGEYRVTVLTEDRLTKFDIEVEKNAASSHHADALAESVAHRVKTRLGVRPRHVHVLAPDALPRATHKAKRLVDQR